MARKSRVGAEAARPAVEVPWEVRKALGEHLHIVGERLSLRPAARLPPSLAAQVDAFGGFGHVVEVMQRERKLGLYHSEGEILAAHNGLLVKIARNHDLIPFDDALNIAKLSMLAAAKKYDYRQGRKFLTYASPSVTGALLHYLRDHTGPAGRFAGRMRTRMEQTIAELTGQLGHHPSVSEIAKHAGTSEAAVHNYLAARSISHASSYEELVESALPRGPRLPDFSERVIDNLALDSALNRLDDRERRLVLGRHLEGCTLTALAKELGLPLATAKNYHDRALRRLREFLSE